MEKKDGKIILYLVIYIRLKHNFFTAQFSYFLAMSTAVFVVICRVSVHVIHNRTNISNTIFQIHATIVDCLAVHAGTLSGKAARKTERVSVPT